ncbi:hypothetical protein KVA01_04400 [Kocuria varians]|uniref:Proteinase inhibitor I25 cystatin n=1 Tax=Kocuria varians TaxID=1272 RepID=A0A4Y4CZC0_KOCVA|nr:DUF2505 domain-containing protein [Kocuria varians]GEC98285.1 hypothetical protein KVA01_04400 [Kocuria varians]
MSVNASTTIKAPVDTVLKTFVDEAFVRHVSDKAGTQLESFEVNGDTSTAFTATTVRSMGADKLPDVVQKFVKGGVKLTQVDTYDAPAADGTRTVRSEIKAGGIPVGATAIQTIKPLGEEETSVDVSGEVQASIPLVGKKIAAAAEPYIGKALTLQARAAEAWIAKG